MSFLLSLATRFSRLCASKPAFISSTSKLENHLLDSQVLVKEILKDLGFPNTLSATTTTFCKRDLELLKVSFQPAIEHKVLPDCKVTDLPKKFFLPEIDSCTFYDKELYVKALAKISDDHIKAFIIDIYYTIMQFDSDDEAVTDRLLNNILVRIIDLHRYPLSVSLFPPCRLYIAGFHYITARPYFVINKDNISLVVIEEKHLEYKNIILSKGFGEARMAAEMLAVGDKINRQTGDISDQTIYAIRAMYTNFTFYKTVIPKMYWEELEVGLPQEQSVVIKRWPKSAIPETGLDIAEPKDREIVLTAFSKIRQHLLQLIKTLYGLLKTFKG